MDRQLIKISKFLSLVLRHKPEEIGIIPDEQGWVDIDELIMRSALREIALTRELIMQVVETNDKQRFAVSEDGARIRARQGHSIQVELDLAPVNPPEFLYHGTVEKFIPAIMESGLLKMKRHHVHLSENMDTAIATGARRGKPIILTIHSSKMHLAGYSFYVTENRVWLTDFVPPEYISW